MSLFKKPLFSNVFAKSPDKEAQAYFEKGVLCLNMGDFNAARDNFTEADKVDHPSASYNLMLMHGAGYTSPYNINLGALYFYKAAKLGHDRAVKKLGFLEAADRGGFGADNLINLLDGTDARNADSLPAELMIYACRFLSVCCKHHEATDLVVAYELDCATFSEKTAVHKFIQRTGVPKSLYEGGEHGLTEGTVADQVTDVLNNLYVAMNQAGYSQNLCLLMRCTIVGYIISQSSLGNDAEPLLGLDKFFA